MMQHFPPLTQQWKGYRDKTIAETDRRLLNQENESVEPAFCHLPQR